MERVSNMIPDFSLRLPVYSAALFFYFASCSCKVSNSEKTVTPPVKSIDLAKYKLVTVIDFREMDGCNFILKSSDGRNLIPENLADSLKKNQLKLMIRYLETNKANVCMAGTTISIIDAQLPVEK